MSQRVRSIAVGVGMKDRFERCRSPRQGDNMRGWSTFASSLRATTVWATLSEIVGTPRVLVPPPCGLGISTASTGGGKYDPEDIRFQILYRLFFRSLSNTSSVTPSTPGAPRLALTRR